MLNKLYTIFTVLMLASLGVNAQVKDNYDHLFRFYYDNDFINVLGKGTDNEYTGGMKIDYFYTKKQPSRSVLNRWMPKAGDEAINTYGWSLMQVAFTPDNIKTTTPDVSDYPYAGGLFAIHTLHSSNPISQFNLQTELVAGVMGPLSYAAETQEGLHRWIHYQTPMGWDQQMKTDLLLNVNLTAEKMLWNPGSALETSVGGNFMIGTMTDAINVYGLIRFGKMKPYYNGYIQQYASSKNNRPRTQIYFIGRPGLSLTAYNAFVDGGVLTGRSSYYRTSHDGTVPYSTDHNIHPFVDAGLMVSSGKISLSITQKIMPTLLEGYGSHAVGNISFTCSW